MIDLTKKREELLTKVSRRYMLRNSAITLTGAALLPSFLTGCRKDVWDYIHEHGGHGGVGGVEITLADLKNAADNLNRMRAMLNDLYDIAYKYDETVFLALESTKENGSWNNFVANIFIDIAFLAAAATAVATGGAALVPAFAFLSAILHDWGIGKDKPDGINGLNGFFADYQGAQLAMQKALDEKLGHLTDVNYPANDYANLLAAWKDPIVINGQTYTLVDLANTNFPEKLDNADEYYKLFNPMYIHHQKSVWNLAIMKCCSYYRNYSYYIHTATMPGGVLLDWARNTFYTNSKGAYLRAAYVGKHEEENPPYIEWEIVEYWLGIDGYQFPEAASKILFKDDTPGHIINDQALFNRSYVFEQFSLRKFEFPYGHELGDEKIGDLNPAADDFFFTGGLFPPLIHL